MHGNELWVCHEFERLALRDARLNKRAKQMAAAALRQPSAGLPRQNEQWRDIKAAYRFLDNCKVGREKLERPHWTNTQNAAVQALGPVLFVQDTTEFDFSSHKAAKGLGPLGTRAKPGLGSFAHNCLAVTPNGQILGLAHQQSWVRGEETWRTDESRADRALRADKESDVWAKTLRALGPVPTGKFWVSVGDRGSDNYDYWTEARSLGWHCLSRVFANRRVALEEHDDRLLTAIRAAPAQACFDVHERARPKHRARTLHLSVAWQEVAVHQPNLRSGKKRQGELPVTLVRCWDAAANVEWLLVATWVVATAEDARQCVDWYTQRWTIEEYHKCLKTGLKFESSQLETQQRLDALLGFTSVLAVRLLQLSREARACPDAPAQGNTDKEFLTVLCLRRKLSAATVTLRQFYHEVAKMGGFIGRKSDGEPGWRTLWEGIRYLAALVQGYRLAKKCG